MTAERYYLHFRHLYKKEARLRASFLCFKDTLSVMDLKNMPQKFSINRELRKKVGVCDRRPYTP